MEGGPGDFRNGGNQVGQGLGEMKDMMSPEEYEKFMSLPESERKK